MKTIKILILDDHKIFSCLLAEALNKESRIIADVADDFKHLLEIIKSEKKDILILDLDLDGMSGFQVIEVLHDLEYQSKVLILSAVTDENTIKSLISLDISGFVSKTQGVDTILEAINDIDNNKNYICSKTKEILHESVDSTLFIDLTKLTNREKEVLKLIGFGLSNDEICEKLCLSIHTIKTHRKNIRLKFHLTSFSELSQIAIKYMKYL